MPNSRAFPISPCAASDSAATRKLAPLGIVTFCIGPPRDPQPATAARTATARNRQRLLGIAASSVLGHRMLAIRALTRPDARAVRERLFQQDRGGERIHVTFPSARGPLHGL